MGDDEVKRKKSNSRAKQESMKTGGGIAKPVNRNEVSNIINSIVPSLDVEIDADCDSDVLFLESGNADPLLFSPLTSLTVVNLKNSNPQHDNLPTVSNNYYLKLNNLRTPEKKSVH